MVLTNPITHPYNGDILDDASVQSRRANHPRGRQQTSGSTMAGILSNEWTATQEQHARNKNEISQKPHKIEHDKDNANQQQDVPRCTRQKQVRNQSSVGDILSNSSSRSANNGLVSSKSRNQTRNNSGSMRDLLAHNNVKLASSSPVDSRVELSTTPWSREEASTWQTSSSSYGKR